MSALTIAVLGPSRPDRVGAAAGIPVQAYEVAAATVGALLADLGHAMVVVPDRGVAVFAMDAYLGRGGSELIGLCPSSGVSESAADPAIALNRARCHRVLDELSWFEQHHAIGQMSDAMICVGLSSGTLCEIAWTKWSLGPRVGVVASTVSAIPPELAAEVRLDPIELEGLGRWLEAVVA